MIKSRIPCILLFSLLAIQTCYPFALWEQFKADVHSHPYITTTAAISFVLFLVNEWRKSKKIGKKERAHSASSSGSLVGTAVPPTTLERVAEGAAITTLGALLTATFTTSPFSTYIGTRTANLVLKYDQEALEAAVALEHYIGSFSQEETDLLNGFTQGIYPKGQGVLLYGPPGTGKSKFAFEFARRSKSMLMEISTSQFSVGYAGDGVALVTQAFKQARQEVASSKRVVLFFEEIDAVGQRDRDTSSAADTSQMGTINQLLFEMNALPQGLMVIATSNKVENLDPALKRFGRFDKKIKMALPGARARMDFLDGKSKELALPGFPLKTCTEETENFSYADLTEVCNRMDENYRLHKRVPSDTYASIIKKVKEEKEDSEKKSKAQQREEREITLFEMQKQDRSWKRWFFNSGERLGLLLLQTGLPGQKGKG